ncbi:hypothetical protein [Paenibacillus humicola]|nr:hypothetical protein [Paenibacillus humicola]
MEELVVSELLAEVSAEGVSIPVQAISSNKPAFDPPMWNELSA